MRDFRAKKSELIVSEIRYARNWIPDIIAGIATAGSLFMFSILFSILM